MVQLQEDDSLTLTVASGNVWITDQAGEPDALRESFMFARPELALLEACSDDVLMSFDA